MSFTGPATFFKAPLITPKRSPLGTPTDSRRAPPTEDGPATPTGHDVAMLGVPYDFAVGFRPGARFAPAAVRAASGRFAIAPSGFYDLATDSRRLAGIDIVDCGDVDPVQLDAEASFARITAAASELRSLARLPVFVGGDHSISYPLLRAYADEAELHVVQFDAHLDFSDERNGTKLSNSSPFRRAFEGGARLGGRTVIGLRGMRADAEAVAASRNMGHDLVHADEVHDSLADVSDRLPEGKRVYLSFDVDVMDPSELPGTSSPEPGGLSFRQVKALLAAVVGRSELVGFDLTELAPDLDPSGRSQLLAARLLAEALAYWWQAAGYRDSTVAPPDAMTSDDHLV